MLRDSDRLIVTVVRHSGAWPAVLAVALLGGAVAELLLPAAIGAAVDGLVAGGDPVRWILPCAALLAVLAGCDTLGVLAGGASGARAARWLRRRAVRAVLGAGPGAGFTAGDVATRTGINADETARAPESLVTAVALLVPAAGSLVALLLIDPWLALTLAAGLVVIAVVLRAFVRRTTAVAAGYQQAQSDIAARLLDALTGARTIAAAGTATPERDRVLAPLPRLRRHGMDLWRANARAGVQAALVLPLLEVCVLAVGGMRLAAGRLTAGELFAAAGYAVLGAGLGAALGRLNVLARARAAAGRMRELLSTAQIPHGTDALPAGPGRLAFHGVSAAGALHDVDLVVPGGSALAVVGRSGSGKSLLAALAGRLADPARGHVSLDGVPLPRLSRPALRAAVSYAFARPSLFGATLSEAIAFGVAPQPDGAVEEAARAAAADAFIRRLPHGYDTPPGRAPMSGGEAQRVGLARAFAQARAGARLLVLDDATSSLDTATEHQVGTALTEEFRGCTRLVVAHRAATAAAADRVLWLERGRIRGLGPHRDLWRDPAYRAVFQTATGREEDR
ncbi:ABC transporter ATP-binding protein [Microtetraspora sp. NBRC 13810]|uniref:ATP-binding cassette domain-containing protein n=1 Tax=Microtetraspora sp. NBRC 13810 TaxID=3030990 RepID=UPI0024A0E27C|nr:ABC transporter ATP-binding protein [Microtetraspora sp. NBRC 13810]GLW13044.1 ABC transporter ATP-binding protein [Microtetraspora sp. NBRC 13810]